ncbi:MAG: major facilitator superfamily 1 [Acidobacteria bacterium]|jgi:MFS family permease|nr:major facilitator superfamily 1 [Acidobacteriota bacterium]
MNEKKTAVWFALWVLFAINTINFFDRQIMGAVGEPIRKEFGLSDASLGALGTAFTLIYAFVGVPLGRLADKIGRKSILSAGVFVWSLLTVGSGLANSFWQIFALRLGVGVGEASCAPAATSLIGDLFPADWRAKALSIFMLGLPVGVALSFAVSGTIAQRYGWRMAFFVAGIPGILCAIAVLFIREPKRGATETHDIGEQKRAGSPYTLILALPTMRWLILSGALHNFNMYAIGSFITPFLMRYHGADIQSANFVSMIVYGVMGAPGLLLGGFIGDAMMKRRTNGRMLVGATAIFLSIPLLFFALGRPNGDIAVFLILMGAGVALMYFYYSTVYSTIQDIVEPGLRGTAMAVYFFAMYVLGASLGPYATGLLSDVFTRRAATAAGILDSSQAALEPFRAEGLHSAMYIIPVLSVLLALVLFAASRTVTKDIEKLQKWMRESANSV